MNDFLTGRAADSAGSLPWVGVWGLLFRSRMLICQGQLARGKEGPPARWAGAGSCASLAVVLLPELFLACPGGPWGVSRTPSVSPPSPPPRVFLYHLPPPPLHTPPQRPAVSSFQLRCRLAPFSRHEPAWEGVKPAPQEPLPAAGPPPKVRRLLRDGGSGG